MSVPDRWDTEAYPARDSAALAQELHDTGLLYLVNAAVLHHHGLALGVLVADGKVTGLSLHQTSDPLGISFDEGATDTARRKLAAAGLIRRNRAGR